MQKLYAPSNWYWIVNGDETKVYSSLLGEYVQPDDAAYIEWLSDGTLPTRIANEAELSDVLRPYGLDGPYISAAEVKIEAGRRIESILPDYKQRNVLAFGLETMMTYGADPLQWPEPLQQVNADMQAKWEAIKAIRIRSDEIEAMDPIPADFRDDKHWPAD